MNKQAFTLIELLAVIVVLGILGTITVGSYQSYTNFSKNKSFEMAEKSFATSAESAYADCFADSTNSFCSNHQSFGYQNEIVYLKELIESGYSERIKNPYDTNTFCDEDLSYVKVIGSGDSSNNKSATYQVCLICGNVESKSCSN